MEQEIINENIDSKSRMLDKEQVTILQRMSSGDLFDSLIHIVDPELEVEKIVLKTQEILLYQEILQQSKSDFFEVVFEEFQSSYTSKFQQQIYTRKFLIAVFRDYLRQLDRILKRHRVTIVEFPSFDWEFNFYQKDDFAYYEKEKVSIDEYDFLNKKVIVTGITD